MIPSIESTSKIHVVKMMVMDNNNELCWYINDNDCRYIDNNDDSKDNARTLFGHIS